MLSMSKSSHIFLVCEAARGLQPATFSGFLQQRFLHARCYSVTCIALDLNWSGRRGIKHEQILTYIFLFAKLHKGCSPQLSVGFFQNNFCMHAATQ